MKLVIDIHEKDYKSIKNGQIPFSVIGTIIKGTPLDKHDEEVIAETVESIWGKPLYMDMLDKIRVEIEQLTITEGGEDYIRKMAELYSLKLKVLKIIDKYRGES